VTITGSHFTPNTAVSMKYYAGATLTTTWLVTASCSGAFTTSVATKGGLARTDKVVATDTAGRTATVTLTILL
jgi:hypothetical protein